MSHLTLTADDPYNFMLPCIDTLRRYNAILYHQKRNFPHPGALINTSWSNLVISVLDFLDAFDAYEQATKSFSGKIYQPLDSNAPSLNKLLRKYETIIYTAFELTDNLCSNIKKCVLPKNKYSEWRLTNPKRWRDRIATICNKIKHEHNVLVGVEGTYTFGTVIGYAVCHYRNECLKPNPLIHSDQEAFSFGNDLRMILSQLYLLSSTISKELERISSNNLANFSNLKLEREHVAFLERVTKFMPLTFHDQTSKNTALFHFDKKSLKIFDKDGTIVPSGRAKQFKTIFSGDGYTKSFHIFYKNT